MPEFSKEKLIAEYKNMKTKLGKKPSIRVFRKQFGTYQVEKLFRSWNELVKAAGDTPSIPFQDKPNKWTKERILESWGKVVRQLGHMPSQPEWGFHKFSPSVSFFSKKIGRWKGEVPSTFVAFAKNKPEWADVLNLVNSSNQDTIDQVEESNLRLSDYQDFIPPAIQGLEKLAVKEGGNVEFEDMVNLAFQLLGFRVRKLGQGTGRNSDGIAIDHENQYAIFIDAKARRDGYSVGTDDRTFIEYVRTWEGDLKRQGIRHIYFVVVSSRFKGTGKQAIENLKKETNSSALVMISAKSLLKLVAAKIQCSAEFDLKGFKDLLLQDGELEQRKVEKWISELEKASL